MDLNNCAVYPNAMRSMEVLCRKPMNHSELIPDAPRYVQVDAAKAGLPQICL